MLSRQSCWIQVAGWLLSSRYIFKFGCLPYSNQKKLIMFHTHTPSPSHLYTSKRKAIEFRLNCYSTPEATNVLFATKKKKKLRCVEFTNCEFAWLTIIILITEVFCVIDLDGFESHQLWMVFFAGQSSFDCLLFFLHNSRYLQLMEPMKFVSLFIYENWYAQSISDVCRVATRNHSFMRLYDRTSMNF